MKIVNDSQIAFGISLGLDLTGKSVRVAQAMIEDLIDTQFHGRNDLGRPSTKQQMLAQRFGHDISCASRRVGDAIISDIMLKLNHDAIAEHNLAPGVTVVNKHDRLQQPRVISSIKEDGTVYLRGGNGARAWARSLSRLLG